MVHAIRIGNETCNRVLVTTDDVSAATIAAQYGATVLMRPPELAQDETPMLPVLQHALKSAGDEWEAVVLLQPTSPLRTRLQVLQALRLLEETGADSVVSVVEVPQHYSPDLACRVISGELVPWETRIDLTPDMNWAPTRRQDCLPAYIRDGTVYAIRRAVIDGGQLFGHPCVPLVIPQAESVTLDTPEDWALAESKHG